MYRGIQISYSSDSIGVVELFLVFWDIREIKIHVYAKRQTWICTTWPSFPLIFRLSFIASTQK